MDKGNIRTLLLLYQQYPCLYVVKSTDYRNRMKREKALKTICDQYIEITGQLLTADAVKKKMNNLRSQYLDYLNKIKQSKSSGASTDEIYKPTWWLYEDMKFLDPHIAQRKGESITKKFFNDQSESLSYNTVTNNDDMEDLQLLDVHNILETEDCNKENIHQDHQSTLSTTSNSSQSHSPTSLRKRKRSETSNETSLLETKNNFWNIALSAIQSMSKSEETVDGLRHWILYLENELRKIKDSKKLKRLQRDIIALVDDNVDTD